MNTMNTFTVIRPFDNQKIDINTPSLFLAGPTHPDINLSWRKEALQILTTLPHLKFKQILVPECTTDIWKNKFDEQVMWEWDALNKAHVILFWMPRNLTILPGFTTNIEFGYYVDKKNIVLGFPNHAAKMRYIELLALKHNKPITKTLLDALVLANHHCDDSIINYEPSVIS